MLAGASFHNLGESMAAKEEPEDPAGPGDGRMGIAGAPVGAVPALSATRGGRAVGGSTDDERILDIADDEMLVSPSSLCHTKMPGGILFGAPTRIRSTLNLYAKKCSEVFWVASVKMPTLFALMRRL